MVFNELSSAFRAKFFNSSADKFVLSYKSNSGIFSDVFEARPGKGSSGVSLVISITLSMELSMELSVKVFVEVMAFFLPMNVLNPSICVSDCSISSTFPNLHPIFLEILPKTTTSEKSAPFKRDFSITFSANNL